MFLPSSSGSGACSSTTTSSTGCTTTRGGGGQGGAPLLLQEYLHQNHQNVAQLVDSTNNEADEQKVKEGQQLQFHYQLMDSACRGGGQGQQARLPRQRERDTRGGGAAADARHKNYWNSDLEFDSKNSNFIDRSNTRQSDIFEAQQRFRYQPGKRYGVTLVKFLVDRGVGFIIPDQELCNQQKKFLSLTSTRY